MKLIKLTGGLGNQMFIYAFYLRMKKDFPDIRLDMSEMCSYDLHNGYELQRLFRVNPPVFRIPLLGKKMFVWLSFKKIREKCWQPYSSGPYTRKRLWPFLYYKGYFQSEAFFQPVREEVRNTFTFDLSMASARTLDCLKKIESDPASVSVHVRRNDYLIPKNRKKFGDICDKAYYERAIARMNRLGDKLTFYLFSDDMKWARENLPLSRVVCVDWNRGEDSWQDMLLMSHCKHNIIANSSFSWWGAWLNRNPNKQVIAPARWFNTMATPNIHPKEWLRL